MKVLIDSYLTSGKWLWFKIATILFSAQLLFVASVLAQNYGTTNAPSPPSGRTGDSSRPNNLSRPSSSTDANRQGNTGNLRPIRQDSNQTSQTSRSTQNLDELQTGSAEEQLKEPTQEQQEEDNQEKEDRKQIVSTPQKFEVERDASLLERSMQPTLTQGLFQEGEQASPLRQFGYNQIFGDRFEFNPVLNSAISKDYKLGPGDEIVIINNGQANTPPYTISVSAEGVLRIPGLNPIIAWNLTMDELTAKIKKLNRFLEISLGQLRSIHVNVLGEVNQPGTHKVPSISSIYNVLALSGGVQKSGSLRKVRWMRKGELIKEVDLYDYLQKGQVLNPNLVKNGDTLFIPLVKNAVALAGQVRRPGIYELKHETTVQEALELAGGMLPNASEERIMIERLTDERRYLIKQIDLKQQSLNQPINNFDIIVIFPVHKNYQQRVTLFGPFENTGVFELKPQMTLQNLIQSGGKILKTAQDKSHIIRIQYKNGDPLPQPEFILFNLREVLAGGQNSNLPLLDRDVVHVYSSESVVFAEGSISQPGTYPFIPGITVEDLIFMTQGFRVDAYQQRVDINRIEFGKNSQLISLDLTNPENLKTRLEPRDTVYFYSNLEFTQRVSIEGAVRSPLSTRFLDNMTVGDLIFRARGLLPQAHQEKVDVIRIQENGKRRLMSVTLTNGTSDFPLMAEDIVRVYPQDVLAQRNVTIRGNIVQSPGSYRHMEGMNVKNLIFLAGGLKNPALFPAITIQRWIKQENDLQRKSMQIKINPISLQTTPEITLEADDVVILRQLPEYDDILTASINGQVEFPGTYEFNQGDRISDLIEKSGSLLKDASLQGIIFTRELLRVKENATDQKIYKDIDRSLLHTTVEAPATLGSPETQLTAAQAVRESVDKQRLNNESLLNTHEEVTELSEEESKTEVLRRERAKIEAVNQGRLIINITSLKEFKGSAQDLELRDGDSLTIPPQLKSVLVKGETFGEGSLPLEDKATAYFYIDRFGGPRSLADMKNIYVIQPSGLIVKNNLDAYEVRAGDTIVVPPNLQPRENELKNTATVVDILFKTISTIALITTVL